MKVYLAARWEQGPLMRSWRLRLSWDGIGCTSRWLDVQAAGVGAIASDDVMRENALVDFADIQAADVLVCYNPLEGADGGRGGRHSELGMALGMEKPVILVGVRTNIFHWYPSVVVVPDRDWPALTAALLDVKWGKAVLPKEGA